MNYFLLWSCVSDHRCGGRDCIGDCSITGDLRWAGTFGVNLDFVARSHCSVEFISLENMQASSWENCTSIIHFAGNFQSIVLPINCTIWSWINIINGQSSTITPLYFLFKTTALINIAFIALLLSVTSGVLISHLSFPSRLFMLRIIIFVLLYLHTCNIIVYSVQMKTYNL